MREMLSRCFAVFVIQASSGFRLLWVGFWITKYAEGREMREMLWVRFKWVEGFGQESCQRIFSTD